MKKLIALTFDDGPSLTTTVEVIEKLRCYGVKATFFLVGNNINEKTAESVRQARAIGCDIENHSLTHCDMTKLSAEEICAEVEETSARIERITGRRPRFFRPPYIAVNRLMADCAGLPFIAGFGARDWEEEVTAEQRAEMVLAAARDGGIILLHDMEGNHPTVAALDEIIPKLLAEGYEFVTVEELFERKGVTPQREPLIIYSFTQQTDMYA